MSVPPNSPHSEDDMTDRMFAQLKPVELDNLTEETHQRRRAADLARALQSSDSQSRARGRFMHRSRRLSMPKIKPYFLIAGTAVAGLAAAVIVVPGALSGGTSPGRPPAISASETTGHLAARKFLLAAAETAAREPDTRGRYWYVRELEYLPPVEVDSDSLGEYDELSVKLSNEFQKKADELESAGKAEEIKALAQEYRQKDEKGRQDYLQKNRLPYSVKISSFNDMWVARDKSEEVLVRQMYSIEPKAVFASPADEQKWKDLGSPDLGLPKKPGIDDRKHDKAHEDENTQFGSGICDDLDTCGKLPTSKAEMEKWLRSDYAKNSGSGKYWGVTSSYAEYLSILAMNLNITPLSSGARAAFLQVLADQPEITSLGKVTDPLGRTGVVLGLSYTSTFPTFDTFGLDLQMHFLFDEGSKRLLAVENTFAPQPRKSVSADEDWSKWLIVVNSGWVDKLGERPDGGSAPSAEPSESPDSKSAPSLTA